MATGETRFSGRLLTFVLLSRCWCTVHPSHQGFWCDLTFVLSMPVFRRTSMQADHFIYAIYDNFSNQTSVYRAVLESMDSFAISAIML